MREYSRNPEMKDMIDKMFDELKTQPGIVRFGPGGTPEETAKFRIIESNTTFDLRICAPLLAPKDILLMNCKLVIVLLHIIMNLLIVFVKRQIHLFLFSRKQVGILYVFLLQFKIMILLVL